MSLYQDQVNDIWADWHQQDYAALKQAVKLAVTQDLASLPEPPPGEDWYGYSLHTCNGFLHVGAILNAIPWSIAENTDSGLDRYTHNCPDEWQHYRKNDYLAPVNGCLCALHEEFDALNDAYEELEWDGVNRPDDVDDYWALHVERIFAAVLEALVDLQKAGHFARLEQSAKPLLTIWFSDASVWEMNMIKESVRRLNSADVHAEFCAVFAAYGEKT